MAVRSANSMLRGVVRARVVTGAAAVAPIFMRPMSSVPMYTALDSLAVKLPYMEVVAWPEKNNMKWSTSDVKVHCTA